MNDVKLTYEQIAEIAGPQDSRRMENWRVQEEEEARSTIVNRVQQRVQTVMLVENMSAQERAAYIIRVEDEKAEMREMIQTLQIDPLTGLNIRRFYEETFPRLIEDRIKQAQIVKELSEYKEGVEEEAPEIAMLMIDADHFKNINDNYGHAAGDFVLKELGKIINELFRKRDIKARYGGEELVVLMAGCDLKMAREKAELLRKTVENHEFIFHPYGERPVIIEPVRVSIGVGGLNLVDEKGSPDQLKQLLEKRADLLVYAAKDLGRNTVVSQDAVDMEKLRARKEKEEGKILPTATTTTTETTARKTSGESTPSAPRA
jgi:diguanylate cyclase